MKNNNKIALFVSVIVLIGLPTLFFFISMFTGNWSYLAWSIPPSLAGGLTGLMLTLKKTKKA